MLKDKTKLRNFLPLFFGFIGLLFLLGAVITYRTKVSGVNYYTTLHLWDIFNKEICPVWASWIILVLILAGCFLPLINLFVKEKAQESICVTAIFCFLIGLVFLASFQYVFDYFKASVIENYKETSIGWGSAVCMLFLALAAFSCVTISPKKYGDSVKGITEDGVLIALAFVLNFIKLPITTGAGSVNFQMLPLFIIALRRGPIHGFVSGGLIYGLLTCLTDGYGIFTYPFDYLLGFGSVAVIGIFRNLILAGDKKYTIEGEVALFFACGLATLIRFFGSSVSSMVFYHLSFAEAAAYNSIYIPVSGAIAAAVVMLLLGPIKMVNKRFPVDVTKAA